MRRAAWIILLAATVFLVPAAAGAPDGSAASAASGPSLIKALLTIKEIAPSYGFRLDGRPRSVTAETQSGDFDVPNLKLYGWTGGVRVGFERKDARLDSALSDATIDMMKFINPDAAHTAYESILTRDSGFPFKVGRIGSESAGRKVVIIVGVRTVMWRYENVVVNLSGGYVTERNNVQQLLALARAQQAKLVRNM